jgi:hypothetical protein
MPPKSKMKRTNHKRSNRHLEPLVRQLPYKFIHLIGGVPAEYYEGEQICYYKKRKPVKLVDTLRQIEKEQRLSTAWRKKQGFDYWNQKYGWAKIAVA